MKKVDSKTAGWEKALLKVVETAKPAKAKKAKKPTKDPKKAAAAKKAWGTKRAKAEAEKKPVKVKPAKKAKAPAKSKKDPKRVAAAKKAWGTKKAKAATKKSPKKKVKKINKKPIKKTNAGKSKKASINPVVSFNQISKVSGIAKKKLRTTAKRKKLDVVIANHHNKGITLDQVPSLVAEIKNNQISATKLEIIKKDEIWFEDLRQKLELTTRQLEIRCKSNGIKTEVRCPKLTFGPEGRYKRTVKKEDAAKLISLYTPIDEVVLKSLVQKGLS